MYYTHVQGQRVKGQVHSLKTSSDCQIIALFEEISVAESNGDVIILNQKLRNSSVYACAVKNWPKTAENK